MTGTELAYKTGMKARRTTGGSAGTEFAYKASMERRLGTFSQNILFEEVMAGATETAFRSYKVETKKKEVNMTTQDKIAKLQLSERFLPVKEAMVVALDYFEEDFVKEIQISEDNTILGRFFYKERLKAKVFVAPSKGLFFIGRPEDDCTHVILFSLDKTEKAFRLYVFRKQDFDSFVAKIDKEVCFFGKSVSIDPVLFSEDVIIEQAEKAGLCKFYSITKTYLSERRWKDDGTAEFEREYIYEKVLGLRRIGEYAIRRGRFFLRPKHLEWILSQILGDDVHLERPAYNYQIFQGTDFYAYTRNGRQEMNIQVKINGQNNDLFYFTIFHLVGSSDKVFIEKTTTTHYLFLHFKNESELDVYFAEAERIKSFAKNAPANKSYFGRDYCGYNVHKKAFRFPEKLDKSGIKYDVLCLEAPEKGAIVVKQPKLSKAI